MKPEAMDNLDCSNLVFRCLELVTIASVDQTCIPLTNVDTVKERF